MIVKSGALKFAGSHRDGEVYVLSIDHGDMGRINGEFTALEVTTIIEGLTDMLLQQVIRDSEKEIRKDGKY